MDLISELPEPILHHILNFLPTTDVARISCLSKSWRSIKSSYSTVSFIQNFFDQEPNNANVFSEFLKNSLQSCVNHQLRVQRFKLYITSDIDPELHEFIDQWVNFVAGGRRLEELRIRIGITSTTRYNLPAQVLVNASKTLTTLSLFSCELDNLAATAASSTGINLPRLQNLVLKYTDVDEILLHNLIRGCPSLVYLEVSGCHRLTSLRVSNLRSLKRICVAFCGPQLRRVQISAPNLEAFTFNGYCSYSHVRYVPCEIDLAACEATLKSLNLFYTNLTREWLQNQISKFIGLETLDLCRIETLESLRISSPRLSRLVLCSCEDLGAATEIDAPRLRELEYIYNKLPFYLVLRTSNLKKVTFKFQLRDHFTVFKELLRKTSHLNDVKVAVMWNQNKRIITHELELNDSVLAYEDSDIMISTMSSLDWFTFWLSKFWWENLYIAAHDSSSDFLKAFHEVVSKKKMEALRAYDNNNGLDNDCEWYYMDDVEIQGINWAEEKAKRADRSWIKLLKAHEKLYDITSLAFKWVFRPGCSGCRCHVCPHCREIRNNNGEMSV